MGGSLAMNNEIESPIDRFRRALWVLIPIWVLLIWGIVYLIG